MVIFYRVKHDLSCFDEGTRLSLFKTDMYLHQTLNKIYKEHVLFMISSIKHG